jgi:SNF2 family DNA or RNA helicase
MTGTYQQAVRWRSLLTKQAALPGVSLQPHQARVVKRMLDPGTSGLIARHGVGSGKSLSSLAVWDALGRPPTAVVVPAALQENYLKEIRKWVGEAPPDLRIISQQLLARQKGLEGPAPELLIVDEQHRAREPQTALHQALKTIPAKKRLLLTGTPVFNHPHDIAAGVNLAAGENVLPATRRDFERKYLRTVTQSPGLLAALQGVPSGQVAEIDRKPELRRILRKYVDFHPGQQEGFPSVAEEVVKVPMGSGQTEIYDAVMGRAPAWIRWKVKLGLPPGKGELEAMRSFLTGARQVSNTNREFVTLAPEEAAKLEAATKDLLATLKADPRHKGIVYSNYLASGLEPVKRRLAKAKIPFGEFSGAMSRKERDELVRQYNADKLRALLITSAGAEGLDTKGTSLVQLLDPSWNVAKEQQIIGRAARYKSHEHLPPDLRKVLVRRYLAQPRAGWLRRLLGTKHEAGADEYIYNLARAKDRLNRQILELAQ